MPNWTRKWSPGDSLNNVSSEFMNLLIDVVRDWLRRKGTQPGKVITPTENTVYVKNESSVNLDQFSIVRVGDDLVAPTEDDDSFFGKVAFKITSPLAAKQFAIIQEPAPANGGVVPARVSSWSLAHVRMNAAAHEHATAIDDDYDKLDSQSQLGPAGIVWHAEPDVWVATDSKAVGDTVSRDGVYYTCILKHNNQQPPNAVYWSIGAVCWALVVVAQSGAAADSSSWPDFNSFRQRCKFYPAGNITGDASTILDANGIVTSKTVVQMAAQNVIHAMPLVVPHEIDIDQIAVWCQTTDAAGLCRVALYDSESQTEIYPRTLLAESNELSTADVGFKTWNGSLTLEGGKCYWLCVLCNSATAKFGATSDVFMKPIWGVSSTAFETLYAIKFTFTYGSFPATFPATIDSSPNGLANGNFIVPVVRLACPETPGSGDGTFDDTTDAIWYDSMTGSNGTLLSAHTPDISPGGAGYTAITANFEIQSNKIRPTATVASFKFNPGLVSNTFEIDVTFAAVVNGNNLSVYVRDDGPGQVQCQLAYAAPNWNITLDDGTLNDTEVVTIVAGSTYTLRIVNTGTSVTATINGASVNIASSVDSTYTQFLIATVVNAVADMTYDELYVEAS